MATANPSSAFTRPNDTTAYASGDLVANSTVAGSVTPLSWLVTPTNTKGPLFIRRVRLKKSTAVTANAQFRVHLYETAPTVTNGDNGAWLSTVSSYLGSFDVSADKVFSDASEGSGVPQSGTGSEIGVPGGTDKTIYGLLEARAAYTPGAQEVFTIYLETYIGPAA